MVTLLRITFTFLITSRFFPIMYNYSGRGIRQPSCWSALEISVLMIALYTYVHLIVIIIKSRYLALKSSFPRYFPWQCPLPFFLPSSGVTDVNTEAAVWAQCASPSLEGQLQPLRGFCKPQESIPVDFT